VRGEGDFRSPPRRTPDGDPRHTYHNYSIAIDPVRQLFNGAPGLVVGWLDMLSLRPGGRVLHVGAGLGYYSALMGHVVGDRGRIVAIEVDPDLASAARENLSSMPWVELRTGNGIGPFEDEFDAILVHAGVTHPQDAWLDAVKPDGRLLLPLTATIPAMGSTLGKGFMVSSPGCQARRSALAPLRSSASTPEWTCETTR
jgi:protein-L-isoaspartate(D-aspartate) O-methyltransferase